MLLHLRAMGFHLLYLITQCYLPQVNTPALIPARGRYTRFTCPGADERLSWPRWLLYAEMVYPSRDSHPYKYCTFVSDWIYSIELASHVAGGKLFQS